MTGRFLRSSPGDHTFTRRQFSPGWPSSHSERNDTTSLSQPPRVSCGQVFPYQSDVRVSFHGSGFEGGRKRAPPPALAAYGMPLNVWIPLRVKPCTVPAVVSTMALVSETTTTVSPEVVE